MNDRQNLLSVKIAAKILVSVLDMPTETKSGHAQEQTEFEQNRRFFWSKKVPKTFETKVLRFF